MKDLGGSKDVYMCKPMRERMMKWMVMQIDKSKTVSRVPTTGTAIDE